MRSQPKPPQTLDEYLLRSREVTMRLLLDQMPVHWRTPVSYVSEHVLDGDRDLGRALAMNSNGRITMRSAFTTHVMPALQHQGLQNGYLYPAVRWMMIEFHEEIHGVGPANPEFARANRLGYARYRHTKAAVEGNTQLATERFGVRYLKRMGLKQLNEGILDPDSIEAGGHNIYPSEKVAMGIITDYAAHKLTDFPQSWSHRRRVDAMIARFACDGSGDFAMSRFYEDVARRAGADLLGPQALWKATGQIAAEFDGALATSWENTVGAAERATQTAIDHVEQICRQIRRHVEFDVSLRLRGDREMPSSHLLRQELTPTLVVARDNPNGSRRIVEAGQLS